MDIDGRVADALEYLRDFPTAKIRQVARDFNVLRGRLRYQIAKLPDQKPRHAANAKLSEAEEKAICSYIDRLDNASFAVCPEFIEDAANYVFRERHSKHDPKPPPRVGPNWVTRFFKRYEYLKKRQTALNADRQAAEDIEKINEYFIRLQKTIFEECIASEDIWNMDEIGF